MKKFAIASILAIAALSASAVELGVNGSRDFANADRNGYGVTIGQKFGAFSATAGFDRYTKGAVDLDKYTIVGGYDVAKVAGATITAKAGVAYLQPQSGQTGYAGLVGVGASYPLTNKLSATVDYRYQAGQTRVESLDGSTVSAGLKYSF